MSNIPWTHERKSAEMWLGQSWSFAQAKLDGWRCTIFKQKAGTPHVAFGREDKPHLEFFARFPRLWDDPAITSFLQQAPERSSLDCELVTDSQAREGVTTALRDASIPLKVVAFGIPFWGGEDVSKASLEWASSRCKLLEIPFAPFYPITEVLESLIFKDPLVFEASKRALLARAKREGYEGWVLKQHGQGEGKWWKCKEEATIDVFITGTKAGEGKYAGKVGALLLSVWHGNESVEVAACSGMTDAQRDEMTALHAVGKLSMRVVEVKFQRLGAKNRLIHPRFERWRPDKPADQCSITQLENL